MSVYPKSDRGYFHLTEHGWVRHDALPFPADRVETWQYEMECQAQDARERVCLTRIWRRSGIAPEIHQSLHKRFGGPIPLSPDRNITLECNI